MNAYFYTDAEVGVPWQGPDYDRVDYCKQHGIAHPRFTWYDWPGWKITTNPSYADAFVTRQRLKHLNRGQVYNLPYLDGNAHRHVFFDLGSDSDPMCWRTWDIPAIFFRSCCNREVMKINPTTVPWPWPVEDIGYRPVGEFEYDVVYQGHPIGNTATMLEGLEGSLMNIHLVHVDNFFPHVRRADPGRAADLRKSYLLSLNKARLVLVPGGNKTGVIRYRLYETMAAGRVPVFWNDDSVLPLADKIDWGRCIVKLSESTLPHCGHHLEAWLAEHTDQQIVEMGQCARATYEKWLKRENWGTIIGNMVKERLHL